MIFPIKIIGNKRILTGLTIPMQQDTLFGLQALFRIYGTPCVFIWDFYIYPHNRFFSSYLYNVIYFKGEFSLPFKQFWWATYSSKVM